MGQAESINIEEHILIGILELVSKYNAKNKKHIVPEDIADMYVESEKTKANN